MPSKIIEAIYENGVFKPIGQVKLTEGTKVIIRVEGISSKGLAKLIKQLSKEYADVKIDPLEQLLEERR